MMAEIRAHEGSVTRQAELMSTEALPTQPINLGQDSLLSRSYQGLLWTNWLTIINDNTFRWLMIGIGKDYIPPEDQGWLLMIGSVLFVMPYILFASIAGWLADRFSKRNVVIACKFLEILVMALGYLAIINENFNLLLFCTFLMGTQSALFAPSKIGIIPELLDESRISAANGYFNLAALSGTIIGMGLGGFLKDQTGEFGLEQAWISGASIIGIAALGTVFSFAILPLPVANPRARFPFTLVGETLRDLWRLWKHGPLFRVALGITFFWAVGALAQLNIDQFAFESGALYESDRTPLLVSLVLGVGFGSVLAGYVSAGRIELGLVPWGALGIAAFSILIFFAPDNFITYPVTINSKYVIACGMLALLGISAGLFDVPLQSYLQFRSPLATRGAVLSAVNFMLFSGILLTSVMFYGMRAPVYSAKYANMPDRFRGLELSGEELERLEEIKTKFKAELERADSSQIATIKSLVEPLERAELRRAALARLLWLDMRAARERGDALTRQGYYEHFPPGSNERVIVKYAYENSSGQPLLTTRQVFLVLGICTIPLFCYSAYRLYLAMSRIFMLWILRIIYRTRVNGYEHLPSEGGAVLVGNHCSWLDGAFWLILIPRRLRMIAWSGNFKNPLMIGIARYCKVILIGGGPKSIYRGLQKARQALGRGEVVGLFPEGLLSKTAQIQTFKPGVMKILDQMPVPIIPVYLDETWGSIFTYSGGKSIWKLPDSFRRPVTLNIGPPLDRPKTIYEVRQAVMKLSAEASFQRQGPFRAPVGKFIRRCKKRRFKLKVADSLGTEMTGGALLMRTIILRRLLRRYVLQEDERPVGILIPPSAASVVANMALALDRRIAVNLNYTVSAEIMNACIHQAGIRHVLTSRKVMEKFNFDLDAEVVFLDDMRSQVSALDKIAGALASYVAPAWLLDRLYKSHRVDPDELLTIIFTSGSTGIPKGVMLTQRNIATNVQAMDQVVHLRKSDWLIGILPFFHSFGYMATMWGVMYHDVAGVYHYSPLDASQIGKLVQKYRATLLLATPTFLRGFYRRCTKEQFASLDIVVTGAEKLPAELSKAFESKFGIKPVEGYGTTELSPLVSLNVPPSRSLERFGPDSRENTVGRPIPNVAAKIIDVDSGKELGGNETGLLWIKGPNVMKGYLNQPEKTAEAIVDGWYNTGDIAFIDEDGFIHITGRLSRFSKIGGEMVPHVRIEEALNGMVNEEGEDGQAIAVTAVPDERKGERLVVLHTEMKKTPEELCQGLVKAGFPNLYIPSVNSFYQVDELPLLGSGKLDLKGVKKLAEEVTTAKNQNAEGGAH